MHPNLITFVWKLLFTSLMTEILPYLLLQKVFLKSYSKLYAIAWKYLKRNFFTYFEWYQPTLKQLWKPFSYKMIKKLITQVKICSFCLKYLHSCVSECNKSAVELSEVSGANYLASILSNIRLFTVPYFSMRSSWYSASYH